MKLVVLKESLQKRLQVIQGIVGSKSTMPILSHMLLSVDDTGVNISATDLDIALKEPLEAEVEEKGSVCIPAKKLYEIVREIPAKKLTIESLDNNWITLTGGRSKFKLAGLSGDDFPAFPEISEGESIVFDSFVLKDIIARVLYATGESDARYTLNGIMFHLNPTESSMTVIGTDGHRLSVIKKPFSGEISEERKVIVPKKAAAEVRKITESYEGDLKISFNKNHIVFIFGEIVLISRLIEGSYPNYEQVIPKNNEKAMIAVREDILGAVKRAAIIGRERTFPVKMELKDETAYFSSNNPDIGEVSEQVAVQYSGEPLTVGFNAHYMVEALQNLPGDEILMEMQDSLIPAVIKQSGSEDYCCVIMPMRI